MRRAKHKTTKFVFILVALLGGFFIADLLWASSSSASQSVAFNWALQNSHAYIIPNVVSNNNTVSAPIKEKAKQDKKDVVPERVLSATFADLPGPELNGRKCQQHQFLVLMVQRFKSRIFFMYLLDMEPLIMYGDGWEIYYVVTGQYGPQCRGPTACTFVLDTATKQWQDLPPLPVPRYAPATQLWRGRLHVMGGSKENRHTPGLEHWSIAVKDGKALEKDWRTEIPIPRGGPHRACVVVNDRLYVIGGQEGDFMAKPGSPIFKCSRRNEVVYDDVYMLDGDMKWKVLPHMPKPDSHIEFAWAIVNNSIVIVGGTTEKHPVTKKMTLVGEIFQFQLDTQKWSVIGKLPYRVKTTLVGFWNGMLHFTSGQRDKGPDDPKPKKVIGEMWRTKLSL
ncbi:Galactose oxidase/kelch repeat superfamily protein [Forsythia ovata]|uniref:Galactose oxidase/kelch repeat superfamily protein n=1 Tax=Forsythia ovata TaxID=205694 RepID=A0ABD1TTS0_9LAMI